jgi:hypothetical protein
VEYGDWLMDSLEQVIATKVICHSDNMGTRIVDMQYQNILARFPAPRKELLC